MEAGFVGDLLVQDLEQQVYGGINLFFSGYVDGRERGTGVSGGGGVAKADEGNVLRNPISPVFQRRDAMNPDLLNYSKRYCLDLLN